MYDANGPVLSSSSVVPPEPKQSKIGIASFVISLVSVIFFCMGFVLSFVYGASQAMVNPANPSVDANSPWILVAGALMCFGMVIALAGLVLGIVAVTRKEEKRGLGIAGLVIGAVVMVVYCILTMLGMIGQMVLG